MKKFLYFLLAIVTLATFGCTGDSSSFLSSVGTPNPNKFQPKGTVTGVLVDACTNDPIADADVYILDRKVTTNSVGVFTIKNIPANTAIGNETTAGSAIVSAIAGTSLLSNGLNTWDTYNVVIDLTRLNAARAKKNLTVYPNIAYHTVKVSYTSLGETSGAASATALTTGNTTSTNHDTPVDGFVANIKPMVGKLSANINVQVVNGVDATPINGAAVQLISLSPIDGFSDPNNFTGDLANTIATKTTATVGGVVGVAQFTNIEAKHFYYAKVTYNDAVTKHAWTGHQIIWAECDGTTTNFFLAGPNPAIPVYDAADNVDNINPFVASTTPADLADIAPSATNKVVFTFSEVLKPTQYLLNTTASSSAGGGIFKDVKVNYLGPKGGNMTYTMAWDSTTAPKVLTFTFATGISSRYEVDCSALLNNPQVTDLATPGNQIISNQNLKVSFTTNGGAPVTVKPTIAFTNSTETVIGWVSVPNAYKYRVFLQPVINGAANGNIYSMDTPNLSFNLDNFAPNTGAGLNNDLNNTMGSSFATAGADAVLKFSFGSTPISYKVTVAALSTDLEMGPVSDALTSTGGKLKIIGYTMTPTGVQPNLNADPATLYYDLFLSFGAPANTSVDVKVTLTLNKAADKSTIEAATVPFALSQVAEVAPAYTPPANAIAPTCVKAVYNEVTDVTIATKPTVTLSYRYTNNAVPNGVTDFLHTKLATSSSVKDLFGSAIGLGADEVDWLLRVNALNQTVPPASPLAGALHIY